MDPCSALSSPTVASFLPFECHLFLLRKRKQCEIPGEREQLTIFFWCLVLQQCINSIDRSLLNEGLLEEASTYPNIRILFQHKVQQIDFDRKTMAVHDLASGKELSVNFDLCIGADGSYSLVRRQMMKVVR